MNIGIIIGTVRADRVSRQVGDWFAAYATERNGQEATFEIVDLRDYTLPLMGLSGTDEQNANIGKWSEKIASFDGYVIVTGEYNRGIPGALKNALDYLQPELHNKAVGYVSYGGLGGLASVETLRLVNAEQELASVRTMVTFSIITDFENMSVFKPAEYNKANADKMLDQLLLWSKAFKTIR